MIYPVKMNRRFPCRVDRHNTIYIFRYFTFCFLLSASSRCINESRRIQLLLELEIFSTTPIFNFEFRTVDVDSPLICKVVQMAADHLPGGNHMQLFWFGIWLLVIHQAELNPQHPAAVVEPVSRDQEEDQQHRQQEKV